MSAFDKLREMISRITGVSASTITPDTTIKQLNMDSMDVCELVSTVEDEFDVLIRKYPNRKRFNGTVRLLN